jgi:hypothetical protein
MCREILTGVVLLCLTASAVAQSEQEPAGPNLCLSIVKEVDRSTQTISLTNKIGIPVWREQVIQDEITGQEESVTETVWELERTATEMRFDQVRIYTAGKKRSSVEALKPGMAVVTFPSGQKLDPRYLDLFREDVLILVIPADAAFAPMEGEAVQKGEIEAPQVDEVEAVAPPPPPVLPLSSAASCP